MVDRCRDRCVRARLCDAQLSDWFRVDEYSTTNAELVDLVTYGIQGNICRSSRVAAECPESLTSG